MKQLIAPFLCLALLSGCATSVGLQDSGIPGQSWHQRVAYQDDDAEEAEEESGAKRFWTAFIGAVIALAVLEYLDSESEDEYSSFDAQAQTQEAPQPLKGWQRALEPAGVE